MESISFAAEVQSVAAVRTASTSPNWRGKSREETELIFWNSGKDMSSANSLSYALENSLKLWQQPPPISPGYFRHQQRVQHDFESSFYDKSSKKSVTENCLGAALDYSWSLDSIKDNYSTSSPSSTLSMSSASRTPSPFHQTVPNGGNSIQPTGTNTSSAIPSVGNCVVHGSGMTADAYSRKVFVGGLPPDIDEDEIREHFLPFGTLSVDWPHKAQSKAYFPPKGYAFLIFQEECSVHALIKNCVMDDGKFYMFVSSVTQTNKKVQIRPWKLSDSNYIMDHTQPIDPRKTIFIGGVPRPLKANELAEIFNSRYGNVCYSGIDCDPELKYPKGAGRVTFSSRVSFMSAVSCRFFQVTYGDIDKKVSSAKITPSCYGVEVKPYVLDDQECDECRGDHCDSQYAPYFCGNIHCLRYYCEHCWTSVHSAPGTQNHRCFIKENGDRPRAINFFSQFSALPRSNSH